MDAESFSKIQRIVSNTQVPWIKALHEFNGVSKSFKPWSCGLSPSALYNCSLGCRKKMNMKTPEVKWMSMKRWVSTTPNGIILPEGVYLSIKRREEFMAFPEPHFSKVDFTVMMFPYGNVWSQVEPGIPITEEWLWSDVGGMLAFEALLKKDAAKPLHGYFSACEKFMSENPDQIGIHLKRKKKHE